MRSRKGKLAAVAGFTLVEVLIAVTILAIGLLGIVKMQMQSGIGNVTSRNMTGAVNLARSKMEELKRVAAYSVQEGIDVELIDPDPLGANPTAGQIEAELGNWASPDFTEGPYNEAETTAAAWDVIFYRDWNVVDDVPIADFKTVRIRVRWTEGSTARSVEIESHIGLKDLVYFE
jgi:prepilin-type N-terminal cleavage/methylation domain-containing protein